MPSILYSQQMLNSIVYLRLVYVIVACGSHFQVTCTFSLLSVIFNSLITNSVTALASNTIASQRRYEKTKIISDSQRQFHTLATLLNLENRTKILRWQAQQNGVGRHSENLTRFSEIENTYQLNGKSLGHL